MTATLPRLLDRLLDQFLELEPEARSSKLTELERPASLVPELVDSYERWNEQKPGEDHQASVEAWRDRILEESA